MKIQHDGDGKLFYVKNDVIYWIVECDVASGDAVALAFTKLLDVAPSAAPNKQSTPSCKCSMCLLWDGPYCPRTS